MRRKVKSLPTPENQLPVLDPLQIDINLETNLQYLQQTFSNCVDVVFHRVRIFQQIDAVLLFVDGLVDKSLIESDILPSLLNRETVERQTGKIFADFLADNVLTSATSRSIDEMKQVVSLIVEGQAILLIHGHTSALALSAGGSEHRSIEEPVTEGTIRGPHEGFNENVWTSTALIRRKIRTPDLKFEALQVGTYTRTQIVIGYIEGIVQQQIVDEIRTRIKRIEIDGILESGYIEELIEDSPYSPFPQVQNTERPDVVAALLLEGRVVILTDGTPFALVAPINLWGALQSSEDYYERYWIATMIRILRYIFILIALALPATYVATVTFNPELLPSNLLLSIAASRESIPFPAVIEALLMEIMFEALREAGVRLPKTVGNAISIVGALVIGQAAVEAGLVSAPMVIIVSITGIASFTIPRFNFAISIRMLRFPLLIAAGTLGYFGLLTGLIAITIHLCSLRSIGIPYTQPVAPLDLSGIKDTFIRAPWWSMRKRPPETAKSNPKREGKSTLPKLRQPKANR